MYRLLKTGKGDRTSKAGGFEHDKRAAMLPSPRENLQGTANDEYTHRAYVHQGRSILRSPLHGDYNLSRQKSCVATISKHTNEL